MRRGLFAVAGVVAAVGLLSGCTAEILPLVAVRVDDAGAVEVVLRPCGDDLVRGPSLTGTPTGQEESGRNVSGWRASGSRRLVDTFDVWWLTLIYLVAMAMLGAHLHHGIWSAAQTLGLTGTAHARQRAKAVGFTLALIISVGFSLVPLAVLAGIIEK